MRDVAWAPSVGVGRGYLASAGQDKMVFVWTQDGAQGQWSRSALPVFGDVVWRVSWSVAGNVLAVSSGESADWAGVANQKSREADHDSAWATAGDGKVTLWKENLKGEFEEVSVRPRVELATPPRCRLQPITDCLPPTCTLHRS